MSDKSRGVVLGVAGTILVAAIGGVAVGQGNASGAGRARRRCRFRRDQRVRTEGHWQGAAAQARQEVQAHRDGPDLEHDGPDGSARTCGSVGATGGVGAQGPAGPAGPAGPTGPQGLPGIDGASGPVILDGNDDEVLGVFLSGGVQLLRDGVLWQVDWDGRVYTEWELGGLAAFYKDSNCTQPVIPSDGMPVQSAVRSGSDYYRLDPTRYSGPLYNQQLTCISMPEGSYYVGDLDSPITKPADLVGPLTVSLS